MKTVWVKEDWRKFSVVGSLFEMFTRNEHSVLEWTIGFKDTEWKGRTTKKERDLNIGKGGLALQRQKWPECTTPVNILIPSPKHD